MRLPRSSLSQSASHSRSRAAGSSSNAASAWARLRSASCWREQAAARSGANPLAAKQPHFAPQGEERHLPVHGGRAEPSGAVRQQAAAGQVRRHAAAGRTCSRAIAPRSSIRTRSCLARSSSLRKHGQCGAELSELLPHLATVVDDIAIVKSMVTDAFNHAPGQILMNTGSQQFGRPSMGAWIALRPGQRIARPARLRRLQHRQQRAQRRQLAAGAAAFCRRSIRACSSAAAATRCCISRTRAASTTSCSATRSMRSSS